MKQAIGYYNELEYTIEIDGKEVYQASNSPFDSQGYTDKQGGVGLKVMKAYCHETALDIAKEYHAKYIGVEYLGEGKCV